MGNWERPHARDHQRPRHRGQDNRTDTQWKYGWRYGLPAVQGKKHERTSLKREGDNLNLSLKRWTEHDAEPDDLASALIPNGSPPKTGNATNSGRRTNSGRSDQIHPKRSDLSRSRSPRPRGVTDPRSSLGPDTNPAAPPPQELTLEDPVPQESASQEPARKSASKKPTGYLTTEWKLASEAQVHYVNALVDRAMEFVQALPNDLPVRELPTPQTLREFITHLFVCGVQRDPSDYIPIYHVTMQKYLTDCPRGTKRVWMPLKKAGVIDYKPYRYIRNRSRAFRLRFPIAAELAACGAEHLLTADLDALSSGETNSGQTDDGVGETSLNASESPTPAFYGLVSGKRYGGEKPKLSTRRCTPSGNRLDKTSLVYKGLNYYASQEARQLIKMHPVQEHLKALRASVRHLSQNPATGVNSFTQQTIEKAIESVYGRFSVDMTAFRTIWAQRPVLIAPNAHVYSYAPAYKPQSFGRISFRGGGAQSASRFFKHAAYSGIAGLRNYDIKSCHTVALRQLAEEAETDDFSVSIQPLDTYRENGGKEGAAQKTGLPVDLIKRVEHAVKQGAWLPSNWSFPWKRAFQRAEALYDDRQHVVKHVPSHLPAILQFIRKWVPVVHTNGQSKGTPPEHKTALKKLRNAFEPIRMMVEKLAHYLATTYWDRHKKRGGPGGWHMTNAAGLSINPFQHEEGHARHTKLMSWYLQGLESAHVHALTILGPDYEYEPIANEHDGLITLGAIPDEAQAEARHTSGFRSAALVQKPFLRNDDTYEDFLRPGPSSLWTGLASSVADHNF